MSSQRWPSAIIAALTSGSPCSSACSVASENTTPNPNVSSRRLRSYTTTSWRGSDFLRSSAKKSPAGPAPTTAAFTVAPLRGNAWPSSRLASRALEELLGDHEVLDLGRALVDPERAHRAVQPVDRVRRHDARPAQDLHRVVHDALPRLGGERLRHR